MHVLLSVNDIIKWTVFRIDLSGDLKLFKKKYLGQSSQDFIEVQFEALKLREHFFFLLKHGPGLEFYTLPFPFIQIICFTFSFQDHLLCWWFFGHSYVWNDVFHNGKFLFGGPNCSLFSCVLLCTWKSEERKTPLSISTNES